MQCIIENDLKASSSVKKRSACSVSIVLPVYNEECYIADCLRNIAVQSQQPYEVIVVDNNSTDRTIEIAKEFDFVRVITEPRQGVVYARSTGFDAASGDIIARLDADTMVPRDWITNIVSAFTDKDLDAVSGAISYYDMPAQVFVAKLDLAARTHLAAKLGNNMFLQATNMAIRRTSWEKVRELVCNKGALHEDFDLAIHLERIGLYVRFSPTMQVAISARCLNDTSISFLKYALLNPGTYAQHKIIARWHLYPFIAFAIIFHPLLKLVYRMYNAEYRTIDLPRVNPATFVD